MTASRITKLVLAAATLIVVCGLGISTTHSKENKPGETSEKKIEYLFVQTAHAVTSQGNRVTLHGIGPATLFFSDRPERIAGHGTTEEFVRDWNQGQDSFAKEPPNAVLSILSGHDGDIEDVVVILKDPQLVGSELTYSVEVLDGKLPASGGGKFTLH